MAMPPAAPPLPQALQGGCMAPGGSAGAPGNGGPCGGGGCCCGPPGGCGPSSGGCGSGAGCIVPPGGCCGPPSHANGPCSALPWQPMPPLGVPGGLPPQGLPQQGQLCVPAQGMLPLGVPPLGVPPPGVPGMPVGPEGVQQMQALIQQHMMAHPELVSQFTQQAAVEYEQAMANTVHPEVLELSHHFNLDDRAARALDQQMKRRKTTFEDDLAALWEILEGARNPSGLLMVKVREMAEGIFRGYSCPEKDVSDFAKKFNLDIQASAKLAEVLARRGDPKEDMRRLAKHLERSNKPSALTMLMLKDMRNGLPIKDPEHQAAVGSLAHERELKKDKDRRRGDRSRDRSRDRGRDRSRDRRRSSRSRDRDRRR